MENDRKKYYGVQNDKISHVAKNNQSLRNDSANITAQIEYETSILTNYLNQFDRATMQEIKALKAKRMEKEKSC